MACWSVENATKAYLKTIKMGQRGREPNVAEFVSAIAAGNNAQLMVVACAGAANAASTILALVAAAHQTKGRVVCILSGLEELPLLENVLGRDVCRVEFVIGEAQNLLLTHYRAADFVLIDCNLENHHGILGAVQEACRRRFNGAVVVGYNAFAGRSWRSGGSNTQLLPIGNGLLVTRITGGGSSGVGNIGRKSQWIVRVDKSTGEEHVFRVRFPQGKEIPA